jgi:hypothetical protein
LLYFLKAGGSHTQISKPNPFKFEDTTPSPSKINLEFGLIAPVDPTLVGVYNLKLTANFKLFTFLDVPSPIVDFTLTITSPCTTAIILQPFVKFKSFYHHFIAQPIKLVREFEQLEDSV